MIQANELRRGNHFQGVVVESITRTGINFTCQYEGYIEKPFEELSPIPLTPELLEKCGFEFSEAFFKTYINEPLFLQEEADAFYMIYSNMRINPKKPLKYLHELQNLYFALTGEELEVVI